MVPGQHGNFDSGFPGLADCAGHRGLRAPAPRSGHPGAPWRRPGAPPPPACAAPRPPGRPWTPGHLRPDRCRGPSAGQTQTANTDSGAPLTQSCSSETARVRLRTSSNAKLTSRGDASAPGGPGRRWPPPWDPRGRASGLRVPRCHPDPGRQQFAQLRGCPFSAGLLEREETVDEYDGGDRPTASARRNGSVRRPAATTRGGWAPPDRVGAEAGAQRGDVVAGEAERRLSEVIRADDLCTGACGLGAFELK
jgi:hypothetical protein